MAIIALSAVKDNIIKEKNNSAASEVNLLIAYEITVITFAFHCK